MPIYDLKCSICDKVIEDEYVRKEDDIPECCDIKMHRLPSMIHPGFPKYGLTLTNVEEHPVHFETKKQLRAYRSKHNLELGALPND